MTRKRKITHICKYCGEAVEMKVITDSDNYNIIKCSNCKQIITEGFGDPEELLDDYVEYERYD